MVDIHSHILWGMDDGAETREMSIAMLEMAAANGTTDIVATPHADTSYAFQPTLIAERRADLQAELGDRIRIHTGCDFHLKFDNIQESLTDPRKYSINGLGWVLVEFSDMMIFPNTEEIFARMQNAGMGIIVTHPERNWLLRRDIERLRRWVEGGAYLQVTGGSLFGTFGTDARRFSEALMAGGLVHFLASDAHDLDLRATRLDKVRDHVADRYGEGYAEALLTTHPLAVIEGRALPPGVLAPPSRSKRWFQFWR
ncbi:MAG TPA: CpsB/CapC family capsule biosynthesis tyrosine phosphatase [Bryobacteraceae bacterium]|nr:CpsB/CapC family capsule biosynthesis tyrosine phosphatase [Bryobacteraceae bacterium]